MVRSTSIGDQYSQRACSLAAGAGIVLARFVYDGAWMTGMGAIENNFLPNSAIAELLALAAESAKMPLQKALGRAARKAFLWPDEASLLVEQGRSLTELPGIGPH